MSFDTLPAELYENIFSFLTPLDLRPTVLAVSRAVPLSPVPLQHLYRQIHVQYPNHAIRLHSCLSRSQKKREIYDSTAPSYLDQIASWINEISIESWVVDAEVVINIFRLLRQSHKFRLQSLNVWIGPSNFAPEHLEELLTEPLLNLDYLSLRFKPYVQKATYQQFLKGSYFDSTLKAIASWPSAIFPSLSIIQDSFDAVTSSEKSSFAQPLVFFRLDIASFMRSHALSSVTSLRFRIPARPVARALCSAPTLSSSSHVPPLPGLEFLDLSSSGIVENEIDLLLIRLPLLKHLILDGCGIFRGDQSPSDWRAMGKRCALIGIQRAREREKALKEWLELQNTSRLMGDMSIAGGVVNEGKKVKPGRRGLATATISLRAPDPVASTVSAPRPTPSSTSTRAANPPPVFHSPTTAAQVPSSAPQKTKEDPIDRAFRALSTKVTPSNSIPSLKSASLKDIQAHYDNKQEKKKNLPVVPGSASPQIASAAIRAESSLLSTPVSPPLLQISGQDVHTISEEPEPSSKGKHSWKQKNAGRSKSKSVAQKKSHKIRVLPSLPSLTSLSVTLPSNIELGTYSMIRSQFEEGWAEGVTQLEGIRARLRTSAVNGYRVMKLATPGDSQERKGGFSESEGSSGRELTQGSEASTEKTRVKAKDLRGLKDLVDVDRTDPDGFGTFKEGSVNLKPPILCFAGSSRNGQHVDDCGHSVAWKVMKDDM